MGSVLQALERSEVRRGPAGGVDSPQGVAVIRFEHDYVVLVPCSSASVGRVGEYGDRATGRGHFLQMAIAKKTYESSICRPERKRGPLGALQFAGSQFAQRLHPDRVLVLRTAGAKCDCRSIRGDDR